MNHALGRAWQAAITGIILGGLSHELGDYDRVQAKLAQALALSRATGDPRLVITTICFLSRTQLFLHRYAGLPELLQEGLRLGAETGDRYGMGICLERMALIAQESGEPGEARRLFHDSMELFEEIGDAWSQARATNSLARMAAAEGQAVAARNGFSAGLQTAAQAGVLSYALEALVGLAGLNLQAGEPQAALEAALFAWHHPSSPDDVRQQALDLQRRAEKRLIAKEAQAIRECLEAQIRAHGIGAVECKFFTSTVCLNSAIFSTSRS